MSEHNHACSSSDHPDCYCDECHGARHGMGIAELRDKPGGNAVIFHEPGGKTHKVTAHPTAADRAKDVKVKTGGKGKPAPKPKPPATPLTPDKTKTIGHNKQLAVLTKGLPNQAGKAYKTTCGDWQNRGFAKKEIQADLAKRMKDAGLSEADAKAAVEGMKGSLYNSHTGKEDEPHAALSRHLVQVWAQTSGDSAPHALAMQLAAKEEFGLDRADPFIRKPGQDAEDGAKALYDAHGPALRAFQRAQYEATQEMFAKEGITHVWARRGIKLYGGVPPVLKGKKAGDKVDIESQPLSSWAIDLSTAKTFAGSDGMVFETAVPVERIAGTARSGQGCLEEFEVVVMDSPGSVVISKAPSYYGYY